MATNTRKRFKKSGNRARWELVLEELDRKYPTEESCLKELRSFICDADKCPDCTYPVSENSVDARKYHCENCGKRGSYTANTFFDGIRCPRAWLALLHFFDGGVRINANQFSKILDIAYSTSYQMFAKLQIVMSEQLESQNNVVKLDAQLFRFAIGKSSRLTPSHVPPSEETYFDESKLPANVKAISKSTAENERLVKIASIRKTHPYVDHVLAMFVKGKRVHLSDLEEIEEVPSFKLNSLLCELAFEKVILDLGWSWYVLYEQDYIDTSKRCLCASHGKRHCPFHTHEKDVLMRKKERERREKADREIALRALAEQEEDARVPIYQLRSVSDHDEMLVLKRIRRIVRWIYRRSGSVSRKYLQTYVARAWFEMDWRFWRGGKLSKACGSHAQITPKDVRDYNTKANVVMMLPTGVELPAPRAEGENQVSLKAC